MSGARPAAPVFNTRPKGVRGGAAAPSGGADDDEAPLSLDETQAKIEQFRSFIDTKLKVDLKRVLDERDRIYQRIADYVELKRNIELLQSSKQSSITTRVNLGCDCYVEAVVPDISLIVVDIGLGFHVQLSLDEAVRFIVDKEQHLQQLAKVLSKRAAVTSSHIRMVYDGIAELMKLQPKQSAKRASAASSFYT